MIPLDPNKEYKSKKGHAYRVIGVEILEGTGKWINKEFRPETIVNIKFETGKRYDWHYDQHDRFIGYWHNEKYFKIN